MVTGLFSDEKQTSVDLCCGANSILFQWVQKKNEEPENGGKEESNSLVVKRYWMKTGRKSRLLPDNYYQEGILFGPSHTHTEILYVAGPAF